MSTLAHVTEQTFEREVKNSTLPVLVDFWAAWCGPCRMLAPIVEDLASEYEGRLKVAKIDVDENPGLATRFGIQSIPTLAIFQDGEVISRIVGFVPKTELKRHLDAALRSHAPSVAVGRK